MYVSVLTYGMLNGGHKKVVYQGLSVHVLGFPQPLKNLNYTNSLALRLAPCRKSNDWPNQCSNLRSKY